MRGRNESRVTSRECDHRVFFSLVHHKLFNYMSASGLDPESDSEGDWEEVPVPEEEKNLEITIATRPAQDKKARLSRADQLLRTNSHKLHTLALLTNAWVRNKWINDPLLHVGFAFIRDIILV